MGLVLVELLDQFLGVGHFHGRQPVILGIRVSLPLDQIQYPFVIWGYLGLQDCYDFGHSLFLISLSLTSSLLFRAASSLFRYDIIAMSL